jgi:hypothetical protein
VDAEEQQVWEQAQVDHFPALELGGSFSDNSLKPAKAYIGRKIQSFDTLKGSGHPRPARERCVDFEGQHGKPREVERTVVVLKPRIDICRPFEPQ